MRMLNSIYFVNIGCERDTWYKLIWWYYCHSSWAISCCAMDWAKDSITESICINLYSGSINVFAPRNIQRAHLTDMGHGCVLLAHVFWLTLRTLQKNSLRKLLFQAPEDKIPELQTEMNYVVLNVEQVKIKYYSNLWKI